MDATKLTRQGVRDLDFGWKKKPVVVAADQAATVPTGAPIEEVAQPDDEHPAPPPAADVPVS